MLGMHILYESACIIGYCTYWVVGEWFVCIVVLQVCVGFGELVSCVHYANVSIFITWFGETKSYHFPKFCRAVRYSSTVLSLKKYVPALLSLT